MRRSHRKPSVELLVLCFVLLIKPFYASATEQHSHADQVNIFVIDKRQGDERPRVIGIDSAHMLLLKEMQIDVENPDFLPGQKIRSRAIKIKDLVSLMKSSVLNEFASSRNAFPNRQGNLPAYGTVIAIVGGGPHGSTVAYQTAKELRQTGRKVSVHWLNEKVVDVKSLPNKVELSLRDPSSSEPDPSHKLQADLVHFADGRRSLGAQLAGATELTMMDWGTETQGAHQVDVAHVLKTTLPDGNPNPWPRITVGGDAVKGILRRTGGGVRIALRTGAYAGKQLAQAAINLGEGHDFQGPLRQYALWCKQHNMTFYNDTERDRDRYSVHPPLPPYSPSTSLPYPYPFENSSTLRHPNGSPGARIRRIYDPLTGQHDFTIFEEQNLDGTRIRKIFDPGKKEVFSEPLTDTRFLLRKVVEHPTEKGRITSKEWDEFDQRTGERTNHIVEEFGEDEHRLKRIDTDVKTGKSETYFKSKPIHLSPLVDTRGRPLAKHSVVSVKPSPANR